MSENEQTLVTVRGLQGKERGIRIVQGVAAMAIGGGFIAAGLDGAGWVWIPIGACALIGGLARIIQGINTRPTAFYNHEDGKPVELALDPGSADMHYIVHKMINGDPSAAGVYTDANGLEWLAVAVLYKHRHPQILQRLDLKCGHCGIAIDRTYMEYRAATSEGVMNDYYILPIDGQAGSVLPDKDGLCPRCGHDHFAVLDRMSITLGP